MPLGPGVRYRVKTFRDKHGKVKSRIRLAFRGNKVIETKKLGKGHTAHKTKYA